MFKKLWNVLLVIILLLAAVWLLLFASNRSLQKQQKSAWATSRTVRSGKSDNAA